MRSDARYGMTRALRCGFPTPPAAGSIPPTTNRKDGVEFVFLGPKPGRFLANWSILLVNKLKFY